MDKKIFIIQEKSITKICAFSCLIRWLNESNRFCRRITQKEKLEFKNVFDHIQPTRVHATTYISPSSNKMNIGKRGTKSSAGEAEGCCGLKLYKFR